MDEALLGNEHAKTAIDIACWDIFGKSVGIPICDLHGGRTGVNLPIISSEYVGEPKEMRTRVAEHRRHDYMGHTIKVGSEPVADAACITAALADKQPGEFFLVDANGRLTVETALPLLRLLPVGLGFVLGGPCATWRECVSLQRRTNVPICFDELATTDSSVIQLITDDAADGIGMKISKNGGLTKCRHQRDSCLSIGYSITVQDTVSSDIPVAAIVHIAQTIPEKYLRCILGTRDIVTVKTADGPFEIVEGRLSAPNLPGLGITPRLDVMGEPVSSYF
ncbi:mandelate racemase/muconate lactonizing enzyme family protein [Aspergillus affinis]|uniref:mandelate racemase/muconate lactonizing enzyme family protein n=1 Tax=Aspergillus affinis TaxID=1070780 RepID=UPI0022FF0786|nr:uncharacterized protein KD926_010481 [Aspergillus affinis]KAI9038746.1 hypothetical protein KD926_010481 [Aspergillus affinis]